MRARRNVKLQGLKDRRGEKGQLRRDGGMCRDEVKSAEVNAYGHFVLKQVTRSSYK